MAGTKKTNYMYKNELVDNHHYFVNLIKLICLKSRLPAEPMPSAKEQAAEPSANVLKGTKVIRLSGKKTRLDTIVNELFRFVLNINCSVCHIISSFLSSD
jgi:hypothetical protein